MIIGISGKAGSGKDTTASLLRLVYSGKDWEIKKFAGKLKEVVSTLLSIPLDKLEDHQVKDSILGEEWWYYAAVKNVRKPTIKIPYLAATKSEAEKYKNVLVKTTVRDFMVSVGHGLRENVSQDFWINLLLNNYDEDKNWIVTDVRYKNEFEAIKSIGGIVIRVERDGLNTGFHPSETELDYAPFDIILKNTGQIPDLLSQVKNLNLTWN